MKAIGMLLASVLVLTSVAFLCAKERSIPISKSVRMSLAKTFPLRRHAKEPQILSITLINLTERKMTLESPWPMVNFKVSATRDGDQLPCLLPSPDAVSGVPGSFELEPHESRIVLFDAAEWFDISVPGNYTVDVKYALTYYGLPSNPDRVTPDEEVTAHENFRFGKFSR
jgi:hypothetical protein